MVPCIRNENEIVFVDGVLSTFPTFMNCIGNIPSPKLIPSLFNGTVKAPLQMQTAMQINNIGNINPREALVELDFYLDLYWTDDRFDMPLYWEKVDPTIQAAGIHLERIFYDPAGSFVWLPDIFFHDGLEVKEQGAIISINASNVIFWQRHLIVSLSQQQFSFEMFPNDVQEITIRYGSFGNDQRFLNLSLTDTPITFVPNIVVPQSQPNFFLHSEWFPVAGAYSSAIFFTPNPLQTASNLTSGYTDAVFIFPVERYTNGIVVRLAIPITILLLLAGATFFVPSCEARISATTGLLIAVTALYIIILDNIPFVGYATTIDMFVLIMLGVLAGIIMVHVVNMQLFNYVYHSSDEKQNENKYPVLKSTGGSPLARLLLDKCNCCSSADSTDRTRAGEHPLSQRVLKPRQPSWLLWFSDESSQILGHVCVASMIRELQQEVKNRDEANTCANSGESSIGADRHDSTSPIFDVVTLNTTRENELKKPIATFAILFSEFLGRAFLVPFILFYTNVLMLDRSLQFIAVGFDIFSLLFFVVVFCSESWRLTSKYYDLYIFTNPLHDKIEMLTTCYDELCITCNQLLRRSAAGSLDVHLHLLTFERLQGIHVKVLQAQNAWLMDRCLRHDVPSAQESLVIVRLQADALREHDACEYQLRALLRPSPSGLSAVAVAAPPPPPTTLPQSHRVLERQGVVGEEEMKAEGNREGEDGGTDFKAGSIHLTSVLSPAPRESSSNLKESDLFSEELSVAYNDLLCVMRVIFRIYPSQAHKLKCIYRPAEAGLE